VRYHTGPLNLERRLGRSLISNWYHGPSRLRDHLSPDIDNALAGWAVLSIIL